MMLLLLEVDGMCEVPRDEAVIEVSEHVYDTYSMHLVICDSALGEVDTARVTVLEWILVAGLLAVCPLSVFK